MNRKILNRAIISSLITFSYVVAVGLFMSNASNIFGQEDTAFTPVAALMLLVFSAAFTGILVVGQPLMLYIDGKKKDALSLLSYTMACLLALTLLTFISLYLFKS